ncbi:MAG TPA: DEAD/DEAH box helicase family protein [Streptosporangiaceae bacterium]|nr:DEAD/DEAH box helicase family protein [Streptosporangiaceae bacterium]
MTSTDSESALGALAFKGTWRGYQQLALDAFEAGLRSGQQQTHIVAPPGSGKTLLGLELVRRLGTRALVLAPNTAVQAQWLRTAGAFGAEPGVAAADPSAPIACLTYQSLCQLDDPAAAIRAQAERRWAADRARATGGSGEPASVDEVLREASGWTGAARERQSRELSRIMATIRREIAKGHDSAIDFDQLLGPGARERIAALSGAGVRTVVLDECHHLASMWGYVVRAALTQLPGAHVVGLTATPPDALTTEEHDLYTGLLGPVTYAIPTPALVRERALAPYQELAWLTRPLAAETAWLAEHDLRFTELITRLHAAEDGVSSLPEWVLVRLRERGRKPGADAEIPWTRFQHAHPALARAGARFIASSDLELPAGIPRGEGYREPPDFDDWLVLLEDYALRCLAPADGAAAAAQYAAIAEALRALGFSLTRQGIRRGASDVDRLLTNSAAKAIALTDVLACEFDARGVQLRAVVLTDTEQAAAPGRGLADLLPADAGSAPAALHAVAADPRTKPLRPLLVTGRGLRCVAEDADALLTALAQAAALAAAPLDGWRAEPSDSGLVRLSAVGSAWQPGLWVELATAAFVTGATRALIGTRAMLSEGWNAPCVNCLVDLSSASTAVFVQQSRGRALRLDPADPAKIASNWDIICVAPELARGTGDYQRFVRKHLHVFAPSEDGAIEAGPSHVHPSLGPFSPPADSEFAQINRSMADRTAQREIALQRWRIGEPYTGSHVQTLVIKVKQPRLQAPKPEQAAAAAGPPPYPISQRGPAFMTIGGLLVFVLGLLTSIYVADFVGVAIAAGSSALAVTRLSQVRRELADVLPLDLTARAICAAYHQLGQLSEQAASSLTIEPRAAGYLRCYLAAATTAENDLFAVALDDVLCPPDFPRYLVSRLVPGRTSIARALLRILIRKPPFARRWAAVPTDLGRTKQRAEAYHSAWTRWLGPSELQFTQRSQAGREAAAQASAEQADYTTSRRQVWV